MSGDSQCIYKERFDGGFVAFAQRCTREYFGARPQEVGDYASVRSKIQRSGTAGSGVETGEDPGRD